MTGESRTASPPVDPAVRQKMNTLGVFHLTNENDTLWHDLSKRVMGFKTAVKQGTVSRKSCLTDWQSLIEQKGVNATL